MSEADVFVKDCFARSLYPDGAVKELAGALEGMNFMQSLAIAEKLNELLRSDQLGELIALAKEDTKSRTTR